MSDVLTEAFLTALVSGGIAASRFLRRARRDGVRAGGVLNIGLEGMMLIGAYVGFSCALYSGFTWVGLGAGLIAGMAVSLLMVLFCVRLGLDQIVIRNRDHAAAEGLTSLLHGAILTDRPRLGTPELVAIPGLDELPVVGRSIFTQHLVVFLGIGLAVAVWWMFGSTTVGLSRKPPETSLLPSTRPESVYRTRSGAVLTAGAGSRPRRRLPRHPRRGNVRAVHDERCGLHRYRHRHARTWPCVLVVVGSLVIGMSLQLHSAAGGTGRHPIDVVNMLPFWPSSSCSSSSAVRHTCRPRLEFRTYAVRASRFEGGRNA